MAIWRIRKQNSQNKTPLTWVVDVKSAWIERNEWQKNSVSLRRLIESFCSRELQAQTNFQRKPWILIHNQINQTLV